MHCLTANINVAEDWTLQSYNTKCSLDCIQTITRCDYVICAFWIFLFWIFIFLLFAHISWMGNPQHQMEIQQSTSMWEKSLSNDSYASSWCSFAFWTPAKFHLVNLSLASKVALTIWGTTMAFHLGSELHESTKYYIHNQNIRN